MIYGLDLFSGIGGITIGLKEYVKTIAYCERNPYAQAVLLSRMEEGKIDKAPIWDDVKTLNGYQFRGVVNIIMGGFPCQDISVAGHGKGLEGERSGLFFEIVRLTKEIRPEFIFLENVPNIRTKGLVTVINEFTKMGYDCRWTCLTASSIGAPHKRERWFMLAHSHHNGLITPEKFGSNEENNRKESKRSNESSEFKRSDRYRKIQKDISKLNLLSSNAHSIGCNQRPRENFKFKKQKTIREDISNFCDTNEFSSTCDNSRWATEPGVGRVAHGVPFRVDRIKCLGNAVVPLQVKKAFEKLIGYEST